MLLGISSKGLFIGTVMDRTSLTYGSIVHLPSMEGLFSPSIDSLLYMMSGSKDPLRFKPVSLNFENFTQA